MSKQRNKRMEYRTNKSPLERQIISNTWNATHNQTSNVAWKVITAELWDTIGEQVGSAFVVVWEQVDEDVPFMDSDDYEYYLEKE